MSKRTIGDLQQMQGLSLDVKVRMTEERIRQWVDEFDIDGVAISFSGGKDSTVLLDIARQLYPDMKAVFVDTGLEYPEIREFVKTFDNVDWIKPKYNFRQVIEKYGYPFISKEVSECVYGAKKYLKKVSGGETNIHGKAYNIKKLLGIGEYKGPNRGGGSEIEDFLENSPWRVKAVFGVLNKDQGMITKETPVKEYSQFNCVRYQFFLEDGAPPISNQCCAVMKKNPIHKYVKETGRKNITAQMASESRLRTQQWINHGCNAFDVKNPISNPMSFWLEQDVLLYIKEHDLPICSVYGDVVEDFKAEGKIEGQLDFSDFGIFEKDRPTLCTTGCARTGCIFCAFGLHLEKGENRFERLSVTHPNLYDYVMRGGAFDENGDWKPTSDGLGYWYCIEWINLHGGFKIKYPNREYYLEKYMTDETAKYLTKGE